MKVGRVSLEELKRVAAEPDFGKTFRKAVIVFPGDALGLHTPSATVTRDQVTIRDDEHTGRERNPFTGELDPRSKRSKNRYIGDELLRKNLPRRAKTLGFSVKPEDVKVHQGLAYAKGKVAIPLPHKDGANVVSQLLARHDTTGRYGVGISVMLGPQFRGQKYQFIAGPL